MPIDGDDGFFPTSGNDLKPEVVNSSRKYRVRVLVCAPSNSVLDKIVLRILNTATTSGAAQCSIGPPGTGKTQTILGILLAILHATPARVHSNRYAA
ncbi:hypothetical protein KY290_036315 [Solanum tuberosum]|uniref:DNA2/NAM7 helicase helicase domain-containing protein n=1 Tax=Solanum tuberosum TaxID=4113 RepID=A0ABQ7TSZ1_SOLTU|nr:hypothetical protein KY290_036315 [Solanum tuberosum]